MPRAHSNKDSPLDIQYKNQRKLLVSLFKSIKAAYSFQRVKTLKDVLVFLGHTEGELEYAYQSRELLDRKITFKEIEHIESSYLWNLDKKYELDKAPKKLSEITITTHEYEGIKYPSEELKGEDIKAVAIIEPIKPQQEGEVKEEDSNAWYYEPLESPKQKAKLFRFQIKAARQSLKKIVDEDKRCILLEAPVGTGKTFMFGAILRHLDDIGYLQRYKCISPWPFLIITKASIVEQTRRVMAQQFGFADQFKCHVVNVEQLRSKFGEFLLEESITNIKGEEHIEWKWHLNMLPLVIILDEAQLAKNQDSIQSKIIQAISELPPNKKIILICTSATPFLRVSEAKYFLVNTHKDISGGSGIKLNLKTWPTYANSIVKKPDEYSPANMEKLMEDMKDYVVSVKGVRPQFKARNGIEVINFRTAEQKKEYDTAYERFLVEKAKIEAKMGERGFVGNGKMMILVELLKFRQAAEKIKVPDICDAMWDAYKNYDQSPVASFNFKYSISLAVKYLHDTYGVSRDDISLIWGGGNTSVSKKKKDKIDIKKKLEGNSALMEMLEEVGIDMIDLNLSQVSEAQTIVIDESLRLGAQSKEERQREIDKFQKGKSRFCFFTFKSGGVGLSLHHTDELTTHWDSSVEGFEKWKVGIDKYNEKLPDALKVKPGKVRRHKNGFAYTEDIPFIPTRQRVLFSATTYSAMELVQGLGRCPRLTSLSDTPQTILFYRGTVEERVAWIVSLKLRCLRKVTKQHDDWTPVILGGVKDDDDDDKKTDEGAQIIKQLEHDAGNSKDEEDEGIIDVEGEEE